MVAIFVCVFVCVCCGVGGGGGAFALIREKKYHGWYLDNGLYMPGIKTETGFSHSKSVVGRNIL